tara:strand:- start:21 stop:1166 length:1146 start_codon:yes stop_codon:yes gene_type:complete
MAILTKGNTYSSGQSVTAANLNALVDSATFKTGNGEAVDGTTLQVHGSGYLMVKDGGISAAKFASGAIDSAIGTGGISDTELATNSVTTIKIADNAITSAKISDTDTQFLVDDTSTQKKVVINEAGADVDFRVEGDTDTNLLVCDATNDAVGIGTAPGGTFKLNVDAGSKTEGFQVTGSVGSGGKTVNSFLVNTHTSGTGTILRFQSALSGSIAKIFHLDLQSDDNRMSLGFFDGDQIGLLIENSNGGSGSETGAIFPITDNKTTLGKAANRWSVVHAGSATINTSDRNLKEDIQELSDAELRVAQACKGLVKRFKFKGGTRKHIGVIAQDVRDAFTAESLDAHEYGLFCSDTWTDEDTGEEVTQLGIRYEELLAFIITAL